MAKREAPVVDVTQGSLRGAWKSKGTVAVFKGVPFAAPPVGDLRWRPPQPSTQWHGVRDATKDGPMAIQRAADLELFMHEILTGQGWGKARVGLLKNMVKYMPQPKQAEDCLYLSVRSPNPDRSAKLPVMVWIHGGDHQDGSGSDVYYNSNALAATGAVTVSINYRLGVMGYLAHPELQAESDHDVAGNYGTMDQIAALEWVRDNISAFGGDPDNVTIFGESAGGESVMHLMTSPLARGLFHRAVPQSPANGGQMVHLDRPLQNIASGLDVGTQFAAALGVSGSDQLAKLRAMSVDQLYGLARADRFLGNHYPVIDGYVLPESPFVAFAEGRQAPVPLMIGSNADEGTLIRPVLDAPMVDFRHQPAPATGLQPEIAEALGADRSDQVAKLRAMSPDQLYGLARTDRFLGNHYPVIDGYVLPESPFVAFAQGRQAPVPLMIGSNADEGTLIRPVLDAPMVDFRHQPAPATGLQPEIAEAFGTDMPRLLELYPGLDNQDLQAEIKFMGDHMFGARAYYYARHHAAAGHQTYLYHFSRVPKSPKQTAGAYHAAELPFVHGSNVPIFPMTAADKALSKEMIGYWSDFAKAGDPNGGPRAVFPSFSPDDPHWLRLDHTISAEPVTRREQYEIFNRRTDRLVAEMMSLAE